ncbi:hypothetical protein HA402_012792 [Bradysia odoriphaga]|nr:hypothetical protein HA402_012792 [Bradysia odoriphaga]
MVKLILISLQTVFAVNAVLSTNIPSGSSDFKYIGSYRSRLGVQGRSTQLFDESNYYVSQNWGAWNTAEFDCERLLNTKLLAVETEEEWKFIKEMLRNYGFGTSYWTSGQYALNEFRWSATNIAFAPFAPWERGYPKKANAGVGVLINYINRYNATWSTVPYTQLHRYICEERVPAPSVIAPPCYQTNDLVIVLDSSGSIGSDNFEKAKQFVERLISAFTVYSPNRVSFVTFSHFATTHIDLTSGLSPADISSTILTTEFEAGSTNTHWGIEVATDQLISSNRGVQMNMVILTDGESNLPSKTVDAAKEAISHGIRTFSVGITQYINQNELLEMAGNDESRVFTTDNFDELINLLAPLSLKICSS